MQLVDSAQATAHDASRHMATLPHRTRGSAQARFFATDSVEKFKFLGSRFLGREIEEVELIALPE